MDDFTIEWIGIKFPKNGTFPWIKIIANKKVFFITAHTGILNPNIKNRTKEIFDLLTEAKNLVY